MSIQWYPGHMAKARKALAEAMPGEDLIIEVLDARAPRASQNPVLAELRGAKPCVRVLAKSDLADPEVTRAWLVALTTPEGEPNGRGRVVAMAGATTRPGETRARVLALCKELAPRTVAGKTRARATRVIVVGVPNVGKSTLINTLAGRRVAKVGDEPAVTKATQQVILDEDVVLSDNPGILWPKLEDEAAAYRLALAGALPDTALDFESVAHFGAALLLERYPESLRARYGLTSLPGGAAEVLLAIGRRRGCIRAGGVIDVHKAADILIHDFRGGLLGKVTLETP